MHEKQSVTRYRVRRRVPSLRDNFFPWGLIGLLLILLPLLFALIWYAKNGIQSTVQTQIEKELVSQNLEWVNVDVDGQAVALSGNGSKSEGDRAVALAKKVKEAAWFGRFSVSSKVKGDFSESVAAMTKLVPKVEVEKSAPVWGKVIGELEAGVLTLTGIVGSQAEKEALLGVAQNRIAPPQLATVVDKLVVSEQSLTLASVPLARRVSDLLSTCKNGRSSSVGGVFSIQCQIEREQVGSLDSLARTAIDGAEIGSITISSSDDCNESFAQILDGKSIGFSIGSANLKPSSAPLLNQIAELAKSCPGLIRVEGHTDKSGSLNTNMALSDARATSVAEALVVRGVKRERLSPEGFGPTRPRAEGDTREAYALNRRIEFYVSE